MEIIRHESIGRDLKRLKCFAAAEESFGAWERLFISKGLAETTGIERFPGFGDRKIYKARVVPLKESIGKSGGYRLIFQVLDGDVCKILVFSRHGIYHDEQDLINIVKERLM